MDGQEFLHDGVSFCSAPNDSPGCYSTFSTNGVSYQHGGGRARDIRREHQMLFMTRNNP